MARLIFDQLPGSPLQTDGIAENRYSLDALLPLLEYSLAMMARAAGFVVVDAPRAGRVGLIPE
jgi:hypothetical protein